MKILFFLLFPIFSYSQIDSSLFKVPLKDGNIIFEKVYFLDSLNNQEKVFNLVKSALIKNTNYKYSKIDEDRASGNISSSIEFLFIAKPGIAKLTFLANTLLSIDVKPNRFRVRLVNNTSYFTALGTNVNYDLTKSYNFELESFHSGKWKAQKSVVLPWIQKLDFILNGFPILIANGQKDDF